MPHRPAAITQADVAGAIRAAKQVGAAGVEIRPDGTIHVSFAPAAGQQQMTDGPAIDHAAEIVL